MYTEFYGLVEKPFELTPDQRYLYLSAHHREALAHLTYGVEERKGFVQLTGEVGTGKTTMLDALVVGLDASTKVARLAHTTIGEIDLLRVLARGFGVELQGVTKSDMLQEIGETLQAWTKQGRNAVFVVDEAQNLSLVVLEEIRLLSNLRANGCSSLQIVLAGQPELRAKLERRELRQLRQRIGIRYHLTPLSRDETGEYIGHRLTVAGGPQRIFERSAVQAIYEYSRGVPRVINTICDRALLAGYAEGRKTVTREIILPTIEAIEGRAPEAPTLLVATGRPPAKPASRRRPRRWLLPVLGVFAVAIVTAGLVWYWAGRRQAASVPAEADTPEQLVEPLAGGRPDGAAPTEEGRAPVERIEDRSTGADRAPPDEAPGSEVGEAGAAAEDLISAAGAASVTARAQEREAAGSASEAQVPSGGATVAAGPDGPFAVVAASSRDEGAARAVASRLSRVGMAASVEPVELPESGLWFRVVLDGGYPSLAAARDAADRVRGAGYDDAWVLRR